MTISTQATVERMFSPISHRRGELCQNPVTAGWFVFGEDPIGIQKEAARKALLAREWFAQHGPPDAPLLPVSEARYASDRGPTVMSFLEKLEHAKGEVIIRDADPWRPPLERLRGQLGDDGVERVTTQIVLDVLGVPQRGRRAGNYRRLAKLMAELGWSALRVRGLTRGGYLEQVRGFARCARL
jgi:hypothetical protein